MRQETYDTEGNIIEFFEITLINDKYITNINGEERESTPEEIEEYEAYHEQVNKEIEIANAQEVVEQAKNSDNPEIASLAEAFSKLMK